MVSAVPTYTPKAGDTTRSWHVIDATDVVLGRLAVAAANLLRGKHKPTFTPNVDGGDFVIVINADKVAFSGQKLDKKLAYRHSGYPGGLSSRTIRELMAKHPDRVVEDAIVGMLPKNKLARQIARKLHVYAGPTHPHVAQQPVPYEIKQVAQ
ncbi:50S ribosomal protein L13 [Mycobacterium intracellulare subsp. chimaera]|uniref:Large ribosomal subunit protein uL13 n=2 Tax=Mycobacterium intracellulare TaxID=1767 RepID=A0A220Y0K3_MYCIT|nr:50S ribosomal protein L13 [Mycobacterium intracellulare subsp. chimaera]ASL17209.1 50S ribosomal protein L13 [Mycobacterium intracellulare subsp. chimaera]ASL23255.1 50S ribosomal protein L13 [Mycobacterium intracellulare subsp. chimaera]BCP01584.1 50S ribosomal protein L13 [Mycobacterium intracellulare]